MKSHDKKEAAHYVCPNCKHDITYKPIRKEWIDEKEVAKRLNMSVQWVRNQRYSNQGPKAHKIGRKVRYKLFDVRAYERTLEKF
ncbi:helix-turn-helix transcriptional regulator [Rhizorhabdus wittichii]